MFSSLPWLTAADHQAIEHEADARTGAGRHQRQRQVGIEAEQLPEEEHRVHGEHQQAAMGEVDDVQDAVDQRQADGDQHIDRRRPAGRSARRRG